MVRYAQSVASRASGGVTRTPAENRALSTVLVHTPCSAKHNPGSVARTYARATCTLSGNPGGVARTLALRQPALAHLTARVTTS